MFGKFSWRFSLWKSSAVAQAAEQFVTLPDGLRIFVRTYAAVGGERGAPVFCLHGLTRNSADFDGIAPFMAQLGRTVYAMDVRGRGRSDYDRDPLHYLPYLYAQDVVHVLNALGLRKAVFFGTSMGGIITMLLAGMIPERIVASVLNDVGPVLNPGGLARIGTYVGNIGPYESWSELIETLKRTQGSAFPDATKEFWKIAARRMARELPDGRVVFDYDPAIAQTFKLPDNATIGVVQTLFSALARQPVLVLRGELSDILTPDRADAMRRVSSKVQVVEVPRVGHAPTLDEPVARSTIQGFLSSVP